MDYTMSPRGLLVHDRSDWPCAVCRPQQIFETRGFYLCEECAHAIVAAAGAGAEGARALLDDITDALAFLESHVLESRLATN